MELLYQDKSILVCIKESGVLSTDEPGGVPELARAALGKPKASVRTVHRLDRVVSGLMVLARTQEAASDLSKQIRDQKFHKEYLDFGIEHLKQSLEGLVVTSSNTA